MPLYGWLNVNLLMSAKPASSGLSNAGCVGDLPSRPSRHFKSAARDAVNAILSAVGYILRLVLAWPRVLQRFVLLAMWRTSLSSLVNGRLKRAEVTEGVTPESRLIQQAEAEDH